MNSANSATFISSMSDPTALTSNSSFAARRKASADLNRSCWVCFATDEDFESRDEYSGGWLKPCKCRNTTKWVHQHCLQRWIDEKQRGNPSIKVQCPQCSYPYVINFPKQSKFIKFLELYEKWIQKSCPIFAAAFAAGAVYWTSVSYGAFTIMQIFGSREGLELLEKGDPLFLLIVMPAIPVCLVLGKLVKWEDLVLKLWRKHSKRLIDFFHAYAGDRSQLPYRRDMATGQMTSQQAARDPVEAAIISDPISATRVLCGALVLPTISLMFGKVFFQNVQTSLQRTLLGGISFIVCKGVLKMYFRQQQFLRTLKRQIEDYQEPEETNDASSTASENVDNETLVTAEIEFEAAGNNVRLNSEEANDSDFLPTD
ncbi:E3 ubiquitin-protein ligase MARCHF5-like [Convolutriloba macropyga]|uniref:E3 ubiquitin-protein ligase MARCHF5-like n=1 Tax=Convolutriloba macropyga TaxID=536237 RepID=UPI003F527D54